MKVRSLRSEEQLDVRGVVWVLQNRIVFVNEAIKLEQLV